MKQLLILSLSIVMCCACGADETSLSASGTPVPEAVEGEFSMGIMDVFSITGRGVVMTGQVASGSIVVGDQVCIPLTNGETAARTVDGIEIFRKLLDRAEKGQMVGLLVQIDKDLVEKGALLHRNCEFEEVSG